MLMDPLIDSLVQRLTLLARANREEAQSLDTPHQIERQGRADAYLSAAQILRAAAGRSVDEIIQQHKLLSGLNEAEAMTLTGRPEQLTHAGRSHAYLQVVEMVRAATAKE